METQTIYSILETVPDPEVPVLSILDLGIVRDVRFENDEVEIDITPTYTGCPAMKAIEDAIVETLAENNFHQVKVKLVYSPAWTTDWMSEEGKRKLQEYGIAPPEKTTPDKSYLMGETKSIACPLCRSVNTEMISQFGSTACKALYRCLDCREPFDYFKCL
ncbi:MAG: phenylacetate-CoA oxygenase subunit PaaJ [Bacteroidia bacterium]|nr:phenylacetate-CoA oxygenase subunit PaaJ [Bacteroidia bacterium]